MLVQCVYPTQCDMWVQGVYPTQCDMLVQCVYPTQYDMLVQCVYPTQCDMWVQCVYLPSMICWSSVCIHRSIVNYEMLGFLWAILSRWPYGLFPPVPYSDIRAVFEAAAKININLFLPIFGRVEGSLLAFRKIFILLTVHSLCLFPVV